MSRNNRTIEKCISKLDQHLKPQAFKALCDPSRLQVLCRLVASTGPVTVSQVADCCGVHLSGVSRHLAILREAGFVKALKQGREVLYELERKDLTGFLRGLADAIDQCHEGCCKK